MIDIHCHILPSLDDGATDWNQSLAMAQVALQDGIRQVICTPHWVPGFFEIDRQRTLKSVLHFQEKLQAAGLPLKVHPGAELRLDFGIIPRLQSQEILTLNDTGRYALIELHEEVIPQNLRHFFWEIQSQGITPVLSHPERNRRLLHDPERLFRWVHMGVLVQITAASLTGSFGSRIQKFTRRILKHRMVHAIGTDAHGFSFRSPKLSEAYQEAERLVGKTLADELVQDNPELILQGLPIVPREPIPLKGRSSFFSFKGFFSLLQRKSH